MTKEFIQVKRDKNVYVCGYSNFEKYKVAEYNSVHIDVPLRDQKRLERFIVQEGVYYNSIVNVISPMIRTSKEDFKTIMEKYYDLFKTVAEHGYKIVPCMYKNIDLPPYMKKFNDVLYKTDLNGNRTFPKNIAFLIDSVAAPATLMAGVRINIATEIFNHTIEQIEKLNNIVDDGKDEIVYKKAAEMLEPVDVFHKNSLQLTKNCMRLEYDFENECTLVHTQYTYEPLRIPKINLIKNSDWNILIVKFNYAKDNNIEWTITTRKIKANYMVKTSTFTRKKLR